MRSFAQRLKEIERQLNDMRTAMFPSSQSDLWMRLCNAEAAVHAAWLCTPEAQVEMVAAHGDDVLALAEGST